MSQFETVKFLVQDRVATISLNRPDKLNSFYQPMRAELLNAIGLANNNKDVRVVIIAAEGRAFSAGTDLDEDTSGVVSDMIKAEYKPIMMAIYESPKLFVSSVKGAAAGIGGALALACDLCIMSHDAYLYQAFIQIALVPDGGTCWHLVNRLGSRRALEMIVDAEKVGSNDCQKLGLANRVVPLEDLHDRTIAWAEELASGPSTTQGYVKKILQSVHSHSLDEIIDLEADYQELAAASADHAEGINAFFEKRKLHFS